MLALWTVDFINKLNNRAFSSFSYFYRFLFLLTSYLLTSHAIFCFSVIPSINLVCNLFSEETNSCIGKNLSFDFLSCIKKLRTKLNQDWENQTKKTENLCREGIHKAKFCWKIHLVIKVVFLSVELFVLLRSLI